ncbi:MAG: hypothetical protein WAV28_03615 [Sedimentisphaerales bacterium]
MKNKKVGEKMDDYKRIEKQLNELQEKRRALGIEIGIMAKTPKSAYNYSSAKLDDWLRQLEKLDEQINVMQGRRIELEPAHFADLNKK